MTSGVPGKNIIVIRKIRRKQPAPKGFPEEYLTFPASTDSFFPPVFIKMVTLQYESICRLKTRRNGKLP